MPPKKDYSQDSIQRYFWMGMRYLMNINRDICIRMLKSIIIVLSIGAFVVGIIQGTVSGTYVRQDNEKELKLVHVVFRHGDRTPADTYPNDPYFNETFSPYGWGHLTNIGKENLFELGQYLRKRYNNFLGKDYYPDVLHAQSTGVTRTRMSLQVVLAGLWPPRNTPMEWNKKLNWQPIPVISEPLNEDKLLLVRTPCPRYHEALEEVLNTSPVINEVAPYKTMMDDLTKITGLEIKTPDDVQSLYSTLRAEQEFGLKLPEWTKNYFPQPLLALTEMSYIYNIYTEEMKKLKGGPFVEKLANEWQDLVKGQLKPRGRKIYLYTGHDSTVVNVLSSFGVWERQFPGYSIMGIFELLQNKKSGEYGVQVYLKKSKADPVPLTIPGCEFFCPLDKVMDFLKPIMPVDRQKECQAKSESFIEPELSGP